LMFFLRRGDQHVGANQIKKPVQTFRPINISRHCRELW
jgi:hypothetical protein